MKDFFASSKIKFIQIAITMLLFLKITSDKISHCNEGDSLEDENCFNNLIKFTNYRAGQFAEDKDGNLFVLYSHSGDKRKRLFYGITDEGSNYFGNSEQKEIGITPDDSNAERRESRIIFVTPTNDPTKQYLFSTSAGYPQATLAELYDIGANTINSYSKLSMDLLETDGSEITSTQYSLIKVPNKNIYFLAFAQGRSITIKNFKFTGSDLENGYVPISTNTDINDNDYSKVISFFLIEEEEVLVLMYAKSFYKGYYDDSGNPIFGANYTKLFYYANDANIQKVNEQSGSSDVDQPPSSNYFFKGISLDGNYSAIIYCRIYSSYVQVVLNISLVQYDQDYSTGYMFMDAKQIVLSSSDYNINTNPEFNEFIKINNTRIAFITTEGMIDTKPSQLSIIFFDLSGDDYSEIEITKYSHNLGSYYLQKEMTAFVYNDFLVFSCTYNNGGTDYNSILAFFGYPYGIDETINLYPYLNSIETFSEGADKNLYKYLSDNMHLENNIFGYKLVDYIRLKTIPIVISFYRLLDSGEEESNLPANSDFGIRHILKQNQELIPANKYYDLEYQYIVKESATSSKLYYGRINKLRFNIDENGNSGNAETECTYELLLNKQSCVTSGTDEEIITKVKEMINQYQHFSSTISVKLSNNQFIEISNDMKEKLFDKDTNLSWLDLGKCADKIRSEIPSLVGKPLIILKLGASSDSAFENYVVFKIFNPDTFEEIPLSICRDINIDLYVDTKMPESVSQSVEEMIDQGYNPFDLNDKFYKEICTPYESPDGTDVLLDDREEYFYSQLNTITCPDGCGTSAYPLDSKYLKCECPIEDDVRLDLKHISGDNVAKSIKSTFKNSNWKAMLCYNLVFDGEIFGKNIGAILTLILFFIYIGFFVYYILEGITPLQDAVAEMMSKEDEKKEAEKNAQDKEKNPAVISFKNPPKKSNSENEENKDKKSSGTILDKKENDIEIISQGNDKKERASINDKDLSKIHIKKDSIYTEEVNLYRKHDTEKGENEEKCEDLDDFQLNNLEYVEACKYDKRSFLKTYWSVLKREHIILFTFISRNDYNLFYVKIERFIILLCTQMFMNGLFFTDDSMHKATKSTDYNFGQQLPKIIFSLIGTHLIEVFLCYLSMTDTVMYEVKDLSKRKHTEQIIAEKINTMKKKLIVYFIVTLVLFAFYWYFVAAFCAVFQNTQKIFLLDFLIGTLLGYIDPFVIYLLKEILRYLSLTKLSDRKGAIVYKISDLIPIF